MVRPDRKVTIGGLVGSIVTICVWLVHEVGNFYIPPGVEGAFVVLLTFVVSYVVRNEPIKQDKISGFGDSGSDSAVGKVDVNEVKR